MLEVVVTEASLPERMGAKTERRGSLLWRTDRTCFVSICCCPSCVRWPTYVWNALSYNAVVLAASIALEMGGEARVSRQ